MNNGNVRGRISLVASLIIFLFCCTLQSYALAADNNDKQVQRPHNSRIKALLEKRKNLLNQAASQDEIYACPMHPEQTSHEPGKCPVCGMFLVARESHDHTAMSAGMAKESHDMTSAGKQVDLMQEDSEQDVIYACPMHPEETSHEPGKCSICGMFLVAQEAHDHNHAGNYADEREADMELMDQHAAPGLFWENNDSQATINQHEHQHAERSSTQVIKRLIPETSAADTSAVNPQAHEHQHVQQSPVEQHDMVTGKTKQVTYICPMHPQLVQHEPGGSCPICGMDLVLKENMALSGDHPQVYLDAAVIQNMGVRTTRVGYHVMEKKIHTQGLVTADDDRLFSIHARAGGWIEKLYLLTEGDRVERKDNLVDFYSPWLNKAQLNYIHALEEYDKLVYDPTNKVEVSAKLDAARNSLRLLNIMDMDIMRIGSSRKVLNTVQMLAPQGGIITDLNVTEGMYVEPYTSMFTIVDLKQVWVMVDIYEHQAPWVREDNKVEITSPAIPGRIWHGVVDFIYPEVDPKTRTLRARIVLKNPDEALLLNMFVNVEIIAGIAKKPVLTVPREAVILTGERESVIKYTGKGHFQPVDVKTGIRGDGNVEILSGLQEGDEIVVSGQFLIDSESSLQASFLRMSE